MPDTMSIKILSLLDIPPYKENLDISSISVSYGRDWSELDASVSEVGVVNPILVRREKEMLQVISGKGRVQAAQKAGILKIAALELDISVEDAFKLYLQENQFRGFNPVERALAFSRYQKISGLSANEVYKEIAHFLGVHPALHIMEEHIAILDLPEVSLVSLAGGRLTFKGAKELLAFSGEERAVITNIIDRFQFGINKQMEVISELWEVSRRDKKSVLQILDEDPLISSQKNGDEFRNALRQMKYPSLSEHEKSFDSVIRELHLPSGVRLLPSPYFEKKEAKIEFCFKNQEELHSIVDGLQHVLLKERHLKRLFELI